MYLWTYATSGVHRFSGLKDCHSREARVPLQELRTVVLYSNGNNDSVRNTAP